MDELVPPFQVSYSETVKSYKLSSLAPPAITKVEPGLASAAQGGATAPLKGLVDELVQLCHEEDLIRLQTAAVEQNIASVTLVLEELKKKRVEPLPFTDHAQAFPIKTEVLASFDGSSDPFSFLVTPSASAAPTVSSTQASPWCRARGDEPQ
ncbi:hypothetical protein IscW_ISCW009567 [Ixodes scapularis]|uniref:Uncharacterized protein n=1 Tax=Ixodes scapularis TaxID=6945 RepID=B7PYE0_IXOSC|nr:hypothetical protein IscW_ISCW009567 [Ixodes scapularis]|eukprot:XP_002402996.1 hypothetical protein IscW_ISCW009567 [Ixodes scapularis]